MWCRFSNTEIEFLMQHMIAIHFIWTVNCPSFRGAQDTPKYGSHHFSQSKNMIIHGCQMSRWNGVWALLIDCPGLQILTSPWQATINLKFLSYEPQCIWREISYFCSVPHRYVLNIIKHRFPTRDKFLEFFVKRSTFQNSMLRSDPT